MWIATANLGATKDDSLMMEARHFPSIPTTDKSAWL
jgi:hypothetical protein